MNDLLQFVRAELQRSVGDLNRVAHESGLAYDTVLRIKNGEGDPGYSKVQRLADYFQKNREAA
jgi:predicted transcriptional regulator